jgi:phosphoribosylformylglycinamidine cyclo-ligase
MPGEKSPISYSSIVDYGDLDPFKVAAQEQATTTSSNIIERTGFSPVERSRGESAFVVDEGDRYSAHVIEGLGTKNLVADEARKIRIAGQIDIAGHMGD